MNDKIKVTNSEWYVMNCLWTAEQSLPLMQIVPLLKQSNGWSKSTSATMVRRMSEKGLIGYNEQGKTKYSRRARKKARRIPPKTKSNSGIAALLKKTDELISF